MTTTLIPRGDSPSPGILVELGDFAMPWMWPVLILEAWLDDDAELVVEYRGVDENHEPHRHGHVFTHRSRPDAPHGGGACILARDGFFFAELDLNGYSRGPDGYPDVPGTLRAWADARHRILDAGGSVVLDRADLIATYLDEPVPA